MRPRKETMNLNFVENLVGLHVYLSMYGLYYERVKYTVSMLHLYIFQILEVQEKYAISELPKKKCKSSIKTD